MRFLMLIATIALLIGAAAPGWSQSASKLDDLAPGVGRTDDSHPVAEIYGFVQADAGYNTGRIDPDWFDVVRPSKLPSFEDEYGKAGDTYFSIRQTRFGIKSWLPTGRGDVKVIFEWELFGVGTDQGQTTIRLRHAYGQYKGLGAGQYWSPFMDIDVFPNSLEYWGPSGMAFFRNVQVRYMPVTGENHIAIALERPGGSGDRGRHDEFISEVSDLKTRFRFPDLSGEYRRTGDWGYVEAAGIVRQLEWDDLSPTAPDLSGEATGWGINLSTNLKLGPNGSTVKAAYLYGEGVQNYMNDATADIAVIEVGSGPVPQLGAKTIPVWGAVLFYDVNLSERWTGTLGYSQISLDYDGTAADPDTFVEGRYGLLSVHHHPVDRVMYGAELQYGGRKNFSDGWDYDVFRIQFSFRYRYSFWLEGK
jgi:hypothetical protein